MASIERGASGCFWEIETEKGHKLYVLGTTNQVGDDILKTHTYMQEKLKEAGQYLSCVHIAADKTPESEAADKIAEKELKEKLPLKELKEAIKQAGDFAKTKGIDVPARNPYGIFDTSGMEEWELTLEEFGAVQQSIIRAAQKEAGTDEYAHQVMPNYLAQQVQRTFPKQERVVGVRLETDDSVQEIIHHVQDRISLLKEFATEDEFNKFVADEKLQQEAWKRGDITAWEAIDSRHLHTKLNGSGLDKTAQKIEEAVDKAEKPVFVFIPIEYALGKNGLLAQFEMKHMKISQHKS